MYKSHTCGELRLANSGDKVTLAGWVHRRRSHGGLTFFDLRDRFGMVQVVADPSFHRSAPGSGAGAHGVGDPGRRCGAPAPGRRRESQPAHRRNRGSSSAGTTVLNPAKTPPFLINKDEETDENTRLRYRYLDLRRERMRRNLELRHRMVKFIRDYLDRAGLHRSRDADPVQDHPRRRPRLPGAIARASGRVLRPAAIAAAVEAAADGGRGGALFPDRPLLPR